MTTRKLVLLIAVVFALGMAGGATVLNLIEAPEPTTVRPIRLREIPDDDRKEAKADRRPDRKPVKKRQDPPPSPVPPPPPEPEPEDDGGAPPAPAPAPAPAGGDDDDDDDDDGESDDGGTDD